MSNFKMPNAYHPSNSEWVRPIESLTSDGVRELQRLKVENAKLRELAKLYADAVSLDCDICLYCDPDLCDTETVPMCDGCRLWEEMHELGVEVKQ